MSEFFDTPIADVITLQNDKKAQLKTPEYQSSGVLPIIDQSSKFICGYTDDFSKKYSKSLPVIVFGDHTLHTKYIDFDFAVGADGTQVIKTQDPHHQHKYLYYVISREIMMMGSEGYKRHLKILRERVVPFTNSVPEQKKIASILTSVDEVIENTQKQIDKLQDLKKSTLNELLTKGIGHTEFKDSELGRIPKTWEVVYLENQLQLMTDFVANGSFEALRNNVEVFDYNEYALYVRLFDLRKGLGHASQKYIDNKSFRFLKKSSLVKNDLLIANIGANVGEVFLMPEVLQPASIAPNMILMRSKNSVDPHFLYNFLISDWGEQLVSLAISGSGQPKINKTDLKKTLILMPPHTEQKEIASIISSVDIVINRKYEKLSQTQSLKKSLMQDLLTGKVRVTVN